ncbi:MAG: ornithine cyclodeaminase family protein [Deltaproteobacteria bacterium]|nr:MAG: ornithine cyclodeaminase family protein [Deltaproteobacteria bacterium]
MKIRILSAADIKAALPMKDAIHIMASAFGQFSAGKALVPLRSRLHTEKGVTLLMPAYLQESKDLAVKVVSIYGKNPSLNMPTVTAVVIVLDPDTGVPLAFMDGDSLTAVRTGAAGGLAAQLLSKQDARRVVVFGAGVQGRAQLRGVMAIRAIEHVFVIDHAEERANEFADEIRTWPQAPEVHVPSTITEAVRKADIILTATTSKTPLFDGNDLQPGTHVTGVGAFTPEMQEIDVNTIKRARVIVDSREACMAEAGDIIKTNAHIEAELGDIVNGKHPGRNNNEEITFFKSVGLAAQDAAAAAAVLARAEVQRLGTMVEMD